MGEASGTRATKSEEEINGKSENQEEVRGESETNEAQAVIGASPGTNLRCGTTFLAGET